MRHETTAAPDREIDRLLFREVLATFPAGVVIVSAMGEGMRPAGLTVSAFCSVSAEPPMVLVCVDKGSKTLSAIRHAGAFTVNILAKGREELALLFASKREDKFAAVVWQAARLPHGGPILRDDAAAYLVCAVARSVDAGDHWVFIGTVHEAGLHEEPMPLLYHQRSFCSVG